MQCAAAAFNSALRVVKSKQAILTSQWKALNRKWKNKPLQISTNWINNPESNGGKKMQPDVMANALGILKISLTDIRLVSTAAVC